MDFSYPPEVEHFRTELRDWLSANLTDELIADRRPSGRDDAAFERLRTWNRAMADAGWAAVSWPREYGGRGATVLEQLVYTEETTRARAPLPLNVIGMNNIAPAIMQYGTESQKLTLLPRMMRADDIWCQGMSEPEAGSDLAALRTRAVRDGPQGSDFVINGQKIWTSTADKSQMMFALVRTEPNAPKHSGISYVLLPMDTPGIEVRALETMSGAIGENSFNQVFFRDVRVPQANVVGKRGEGWKIAHTTLVHERASLNANAEGLLLRLIRLMRKEASNGVPALASPVYRDRLLRLQARALAMKHHGMRLLTCGLRGESAGVAGLVVKLSNCQLSFDIAALAIDVMGELGSLYDHAKYERERGFWQAHSFFALGLIIGGGTAQIQKNIIAERGLGLPREPKVATA